MATGRGLRTRVKSATKAQAKSSNRERHIRSPKMQIGVDSFAAAISDPATGATLRPVERMQHLLDEMELADRVSLDVFGIGEHHRADHPEHAARHLPG